MTANQHKQAWRTDYRKPDPGVRPRFSPELDRAQRDAEIAEAEEEAAKVVCMVICGLALLLVGVVVLL